MHYAFCQIFVAPQLYHVFAFSNDQDQILTKYLI